LIFSFAEFNFIYHICDSRTEPFAFLALISMRQFINFDLL